MRRQAIAPLVVCVALLSGGPDRAAAQLGSPEIMSSAPDSPVFAFLGGSPTKIQQPGGVRELGASLLSAIGEDGRVRQGFAIEVAPWSLIPGITINLDDYQQNLLKYVLANAQLSVGSVRAAGDSASTDLGFGLRLTIIDRSDPMRDRDFTANVAALISPCTRDPEATPEQIEECSDAAMREAFADSSAARWNEGSLSVGGAMGIRFERSELRESSARGAQVWVAGAIPVYNFGHLIGQGTWQHTPAIEDVGETDLLSYGARAVIGTSWFGVFGEVVGESRQVDDVNQDGVAWSAGAELRIASHLWLTAGLGERFDALTTEDRTVLIANVRFGVADATRLASLR